MEPEQPTSRFLTCGVELELELKPRAKLQLKYGHILEQSGDKSLTALAAIINTELQLTSKVGSRSDSGYHTSFIQGQDSDNGRYVGSIPSYLGRCHRDRERQEEWIDL